MNQIAQAVKAADVVLAIGADAEIMLEAARFMASPGAEIAAASDPKELDRIAALHFRAASQRVMLVVEKSAMDWLSEAETVLRDRQRRALATSISVLGHVDCARRFIENLPMLDQCTFTANLGEPLQGTPVFNVGAGPSLDRNKRLLGKASERGLVFTVTTSASAVEHPVDAIFCAEFRDQSWMFGAHEGAVRILSACCHPDNLRAALDTGPTSIVISTQPSLALHAYQLGTPMINWAASSACMSASTAIWLGADPIVLVGQDCSWPGERLYANGTPYEDMHAVLVDESTTSFVGTSKEIGAQQTVRIPAWGGRGTVITGQGMEDIADWFAEAGKSHTFINATEGGARLGEITEVPLEQALDDLDTSSDEARRRFRAAAESTDLKPKTGREVLAWIAQEAEAILRDDPCLISEVQQRLPITAYWMVAHTQRARAGSLGVNGRIDGARKAIREAARDIVNICEEAAKQ